jgi:hypothetical protein
LLVDQAIERTQRVVATVKVPFFHFL